MNKIMKTLSLMFAVGAMLFSSGLHHEDAKVAKASEASIYFYTFTKKVFTSNSTCSLGEINWTLTGDSNPSNYDNSNDRGQQFGTAKSPYTAMTLSTNDITDTISSIKINTAGASGTDASLIVTVGEIQYGSEAKLTKDATEHTFDNTNNPSSGEIKLSYTQTSKKAIYIKSIEIYKTIETSSDTKVTSIEITPNINEIEVNKTCQLSANVLPVNAFNRTVTWSSDNENIATIDDTGKVTGISVGSTTVKATANDGSGVYGSATVSVIAGPTIEYTVSNKEDVVDNFIEVTGSKLFITKIGSSYFGCETSGSNRGLQFGSGTDSIIVNIETIGDIISLDNNSIIINAATTSKAGSSAQLSVFIDDNQIGETKTLTTKATDYTFISSEKISGVLKIVLSANGAVYFKALKVFGTVTKLSEDKTNLNKLIAEMKVKNTCNDYNDSVELREQYNALSDESKAIFDSTVITDAYEKDENIEAGVTVTLSDKLAYMEYLVSLEAKDAESSINLFVGNNSNNMSLILIVGLLGLTAIAGYYFINKKKYNIQ